MDILIEMIDLCHERMSEVRQQLTYYRASVYKDEMAGPINDKVDQLRLVAGLFGDELLTEAFIDYDAMSCDGVLTYVPGECSFSRRVTVLLAALDQHLARLGRDIASRSLALLSDVEFTETVRQHRSELLALCRQGSRQWTFFQSL